MKHHLEVESPSLSSLLKHPRVLQKESIKRRNVKMEEAKGGEKKISELKRGLQDTKKSRRVQSFAYCVVGQVLSSSVPRSSAANVVGFARIYPINLETVWHCLRRVQEYWPPVQS